MKSPGGLACFAARDPGARAPAADPVAIRACLPPEVAAVFDREWEAVLEAAKYSKDLAGVRELLAHWRHHAYQELLEPGVYFRVSPSSPPTCSSTTRQRWTT